jgi:hypothetical protein
MAIYDCGFPQLGQNFAPAVILALHAVQLPGIIDLPH